MGQKVQEAFGYVALAANSSTQIIGSGAGAGNLSLGGFLCTTAGNLQVTEGTVAVPGGNIVAAFAVVVGTFYPIPCTAPLGAVAVLSGGAAGTFFYG